MHTDASAWRRLIGAYLVSVAGTEVSRVALFAHAYVLGANTSTLAVLVGAQAVGGMMGAPFGGVLADRSRQRTVLITADLFRTAMFVWMSTTQSLALLIALAMFASMANGAFEPAEASLEAELLDETALVRANAIRSASRNALTIAGPVVAGLIIATGGTGCALLFDAATYLVSGALLVGLPASVRSVHSSTRGWIVEVQEGVSALSGRPALRRLLLAQAIVVLLLGMQGPLLYTFNVTHLGGDGTTYGVLMSALGVGAVIGAVWLARATVEPSLRRLMAVMVVDGLALGMFVAIPWLPASLVAMVGMGMISSVFWVTSRAWLQTYVESGLRGRVIALVAAIQSPLMLVSLLVPLLATVDSYWILAGAALVEIVAGCVLLVTVADTRPRSEL